MLILLLTDMKHVTYANNMFHVLIETICNMFHILGKRNH
ncbi:protein of unknown function [[Clostridium] ultunense Esp]|uniref:Uncharacterized protein n=1 Tax=[Clostridium] ultunense Esp TaxID=1288971 RepID=A0A1M4PLU9_9FIRM|nr:protein of unknown function [[Clostridium] ultunense Esp]